MQVGGWVVVKRKKQQLQSAAASGGGREGERGVVQRRPQPQLSSVESQLPDYCTSMASPIFFYAIMFTLG